MHHQFKSNMLAGASYDESSKVLTILFLKGGEYIYKDVPKEIYNELITAESAGKYFLANIKNKFETEKI